MTSNDRSRVDLEVFSDRELWEYLKKRLDPKHNWEPYLVGRSAVRISDVLTAEQKDIELLMGAAADKLAAFEQECRQQQSKGQQAYFRAAGEHAQWRSRVLKFKRLVDRRAAEAKRAATTAKRELTEFEDRRRREQGRDALRRLALAVDAHRRAQVAAGVPASPADRELWLQLEVLTVPLMDEPVSLAEMIERRHWTEGRRDGR